MRFGHVGDCWSKPAHLCPTVRATLTRMATLAPSLQRLLGGQDPQVSIPVLVYADAALNETELEAWCMIELAVTAERVFRAPAMFAEGVSASGWLACALVHVDAAQLQHLAQASSIAHVSLAV